MFDLSSDEFTPSTAPKMALQLHREHLARRARMTPPKPIKSIVPTEPSRVMTDISTTDYIRAHLLADSLTGKDATSLPKTAWIQHVVAMDYEITVGDMLSNRRTAFIMEPRMVAEWLTRELRPDSYPTIGRKFNRDHTSIISAMHKITKLLAADPAFAARVERLKRDIKAGPDPILLPTTNS